MFAIGRHQRRATSVPSGSLAPSENRMAALTKAELGEFRKQLESIQARIRGDVRDLADGAFDRDAGESRSPTHPAELGSENFEQDFALNLISNEQDILADIADALDKIENGSYGLCEGCQVEGSTKKSYIPKARLKAIPWTRNCVECERRKEVHY